MSKRILGRDIEVSSIGLGCMGMSHAYGRPSDKTEAKNYVYMEGNYYLLFLSIHRN